VKGIKVGIEMISSWFGAFIGFQRPNKFKYH